MSQAPTAGKILGIMGNMMPIIYEYRDLTPDEEASLEASPPGYRRCLRRVAGESLWFVHHVNTDESVLS